MKISRVRAITCEIPLAQPIVMGDLFFASREYVLVVIETDAGISGIGFGMSRNAPIAAIVARNLAPLLVGQDPLMTEALWERLYYRNLTISGRGIFMRALSAVDVALWDIKGQAAGLPIWKLLGGVREQVPVTVAGGYVGADKSLDDLGREIDDYAQRGFSLVKMSAGQLAEDTARIQVAVAALAGRSELAYDGHWAWRNLYDTVPTVTGWRDLGLAFVEDPFVPELVGLAADLRAATGLRLALGEDAVGRWAFDQLFKVCLPDVVRVDATTAGGLSETVKICALASVHARPVLPHIFPEIHIHLAAALSTVMAVETTVAEYEVDVLPRLFSTSLPIENGVMRAPAQPGLGVVLDAPAVARYSVGELVVAEPA
jgi:L-alanine-DL-glutamate epimerase-like enolase superfamily enzyme